MSHKNHAERQAEQVNHRPNWKRPHHDWRIVAVAILMILAMVIYIMSDDLAWSPFGAPRKTQQPILGAI